MRNDVYMIYGTDYEEMAYRILEAANVRAQIPGRHAKIAFKPNLVLDASPDQGATTHPELIAGAIRYFHEHGYDNLVVMESSWVGAKTMTAAKKAGYLDLCARFHVPFIDLQKDHYSVHDCHGMPLKICDEAMKVDYMINVPVLKGHCQTKITCALKNNKGLIPNVEKRRFHTMGLHQPIAHLNTVVPQHFVLVDNICGDLDFEEGGNPVVMNRVMGFFDPVLCDAFVAETLGYQPSDIAYITIAEALGVGSADTTQAHIIALNEPIGFRVPRMTRSVQRLARHVAAKDACSACYGSLIHALHRLDETQGLKGKEKICIGQGYQGLTGPIGVGRCTQGCQKHLGGCPPKATDILQFLQENW